MPYQDKNNYSSPVALTLKALTLRGAFRASALRVLKGTVMSAEVNSSFDHIACRHKLLPHV